MATQAKQMRLLSIRTRIGDPYRTHRLLRRPARRPGDACGWNADIDTEPHADAPRHLQRDDLAYCPVDFQSSRVYAQCLLLDGVAVGHDAAEKVTRRSWDVG